MKNKSEHVKRWRKRNKSKAIKAMGGKCAICGYNKCDEALDFHHINSNDKEISLGFLRKNPRKWSIVAKELKKCILLCSNCHMEVHDGVTKLPDDYYYFNDTFIKKEKIKKESLSIKSYKCNYCGRYFKDKEYANRIHCSKECAWLHKRKVKNRPSLQELKKMKEKMSMCAIGRKYGVSDNAVRKWMKE